MSKSITLVYLFLLLLLLLPAASPLSFNMSTITNFEAGSFNLEGDAYIDRGIQITTNDRFRALSNSIGRATYKEPLLLWDSASGNLSDFSSNFSFTINSNGNYSYGDGLAFFLAPLDSTLNKTLFGGFLGLGDVNSSSSPSDSFVGVAFDTFMNYFDYLYDPEVGIYGMPFTSVLININNMTSVNGTLWENDVTRGFKNDAWIKYDGVSKMLEVEFTGTKDGIKQRGNLVFQVDLRDYLPERVMVGFSATTGVCFEQHVIESWSFSSTLQLPNDQVDQVDQVPSMQKPRKNYKGLISGLSASGSVLILATAFAVFVFWRKKKYNSLNEDGHSDSSSMDKEFSEGTMPRKYSYNQLALATSNFAKQQKLGEGGFGEVYKGFLNSTNTLVAVKRVSQGSKQGRKEYAAEVKIISQLRHMNLVQLIGWCHQRSDLLLVYEFMPNKSLDSHLFQSDSVLKWETRYKIASGLASALLYLHEELRQYVVHRDIKASNIMLDAEFNAKLGDFGLARLVDHDKDSQTTVPAGTLGYMAPEYIVTGRASKETDIYSFGIVLLEIACGRRAIECKYPRNQAVLVEWVWGLYGGGLLLDGVDPKLGSSEDNGDNIERLMIVGLWCVHPDSSQRPSIRQVMQVLNCEAHLPGIPLAMPKAVYEYDATGVVGVSGPSSKSTTSYLLTTSSTPDLLPESG